MSLYRRWIHSWEHRLTRRDQNRRIFPFSWGTEWLEGVDEAAPLESIQSWAEEKLEESHTFFRPDPMEEVEESEVLLRFETPTPTPFEENNRAICRIWPARESNRAVVVVPQWNADAGSHVGLCRILSRLGITAVRLTMPYHEDRSPSDMPRADLMVGPNVGRTLHATRQAVLEVRQIVGKLKREGYEKIGVLGTSLGSCVAYLAFCHEPDIRCGVFNHVSAYFADVVWTGLSTRYVRWGMEGYIDLEDLRVCWAPLSPWHFIPELSGRRRHLMITAKYDLTFLPELSNLVFDRYDRLGIRCDRVELPCGHYTTAKTPFKYLDGFHICRYLRRYL